MNTLKRFEIDVEFKKRPTGLLEGCGKKWRFIEYADNRELALKSLSEQNSSPFRILNIVEKYLHSEGIPL